MIRNQSAVIKIVIHLDNPGTEGSRRQKEKPVTGISQGGYARLKRYDLSRFRKEPTVGAERTESGREFQR